MKNKIIIPFWLFSILFLFYSTAFSGERPKYFRGLKWGVHISQVQGLVLKEEKPFVTNDPEIKKLRDKKEKCGERIYYRPSDDLEVGHGQVDVIEYIFVKDQLTEVIMRFNDYAQYLNFKSLFLDLYGPPDREEKRKGAIDKTTEHLWYANIDDEANVTLFWMEWTGGRSGSALMKWKGALKKDTGL